MGDLGEEVTKPTPIANLNTARILTGWRGRAREPERARLRCRRIGVSRLAVGARLRAGDRVRRLDRTRRLETIVNVVAAEDAAILEGEAASWRT